MSKKQEVQTKPLGRFENTLSTLINDNISAIPKGVNAERLRVNALMAISQDRKLMEVAQKKPGKIAQIVYNFITLGLDMHQNEAYIIPYGDEPTVIIDYKGEVKLAKKYSVNPIREIYARAVRQNDEYGFDELDQFNHQFDPFKSDEERGELIGAFCTVIYENGVVQTEFVNNDEIKRVKKASKSSNSPHSPWKTWEETMYRKTAIKKAMKNISLDFESIEVQEAYKESDNDVDFTRPQHDIKQQDEPDMEAAEIIDAEVVESNDDSKDKNIINIENVGER